MSGLIVTSGSAAAAQDQKPISGQVVEKNGAGVVGVTVWAVGGSEDAPETVAETVTDIQGKFTFAKLPPLATVKSASGLLPGRVGYDLVARAKDGQLAWIGKFQISQQDTTDLRLPLVERADIRGRFVDQVGKPIAGVEIAPTSLSRDENPVRGAIRAILPSALSSSLRVTTAPDGSFVFLRFPQVSIIQAKIRVDGLGTVRVAWRPASEPITITLDRRVGQITGRFKLPDQRRLKGTSTIALTWVTEPRNQSAGEKFWIYDNRRTAVDLDGSFRFEAVLPGQYILRPDLDFAVPFIALSDSNNLIKVEPGATAVAPEIPLEPVVTVTGRVIDAETEKGIQGVSVSGHVFNLPGGTSATLPLTQTDGEGRYRLKAGRGSLRVMVSSVPKPYFSPDLNQNPNVEISADRTWPDVKLSRGSTIEGLVVDGAGQPVAGAEISLMGSGNRFSNMSGILNSARNGAFPLDSVPPGPIAIRAYAKDKGATTNGAIVVRARDLNGKLTITVDPKFAFRIRGTVADRSGKPIQGAKITLFWTRKMPSDDPRRGGGSLGTSWETYSTDDSGKFECGPLFPGDQYSLNVTAEGYAPFQTPEIIGTPGMFKGLGKIRLVGTSGHVAGIVVGLDGKPIPDVAVFNRGNGLEPVKTKTDTQGRFRLEKLFPGHKYAFAQKDGYRFTAALVERDRDDLAIRLLRSNEPPPPWKPAEGRSFDEQRELARRILLRLWVIHSQRLEGQQKDAALTALVLPMAQLDPAVALEWSGQLGGQLDAQVRLAGAEVLAAFDAQAAIEVIKKTPESAMALEQLLKLATWFAETDPPRAIAFAREAAAQARAIDKLAPIQAKARAGGLLIRLGRTDEGRKLVEEAAEALARPAPAAPKQPGMVRLNTGLIATARALALFDLKRALALAEPSQQSSPERMKAIFAPAVAMTNPVQAVELVKGPGNRQSNWNNVLIEVVYRCGVQRPDEALKIIERMKDDEALSYKAEALGWLAVAVAKRDPEQAFGLIDRALALLIDHGAADMQFRASGGADTTAARVALCARRVGYPDMESVLARVLAARSVASCSPWGEGTRSSTTALAALLDPAVAREMLLQAEASAGSLPMPESPESRSLSRPRVYSRPHMELIARILADSTQARNAIDAVLAEVEHTKGVSPQTYALTELAKVLAASPSHREEILWGERFDTWYPGRMPYGE